MRLVSRRCESPLRRKEIIRRNQEFIKLCTLIFKRAP